MTDLDALTVKADELSAATVQARTAARAEVEERVLEATEAQRIELSRLVHEAHAAGTPKHVLAKACRKSGNPAGFAAIWNAFEPEFATDLRRRSRSASVEVSREVQHRFEWDGPDLRVIVDGEGYHLDGLTGEGDLVEWSNVDDHMDDVELYAQLARAAAEAIELKGESA